MNGNDLLDRRAERGSARGAEIVWANAQLEHSPKQRPERSAVLLRVALVAWVIGLGVVVYINTNDNTSLDTAQADVDRDQTPTESAEPLPEPVVVDGMTLERVSRPFDPDFDGDDILDDLGFTRGEVTHFGTEAQPERSVVFADPDDPFNNPVLGLDLLDGGGFRPWSANTGETPLTDLTSQLVQVDGEWTMPEESGLVEVARFEGGSSYDNLMFGWQFDFANGNEEVILQAEASPQGAEQTVWVWVARLSQGADQPLILGEIDVLDQRGILIDLGRSDEPSDEVIWAAGDFVYRLTASTVQGNTALSRNASPATTRLQLVDRAEWVAAINRAERTSTTEIVVLVLAGLLALTLIGSVIVFAFRRSWTAVAVALLTIAAVVLVGSGTISNLLLLVLGLLMAWWLHRSTRQLPDAPVL